MQKETYYKLNRLTLLACLVLAFVLPLIPISSKFSLREADQNLAPLGKQLIVTATRTQDPAVLATTIGNDATTDTEVTSGTADQALAHQDTAIESPNFINDVVSHQPSLIDKILKYAVWV
ncbi:MAG: hypothetical protein EOO93_25430, partial [Pedobacter sp.]